MLLQSALSSGLSDLHLNFGDLNDEMLLGALVGLELAGYQFLRHFKGEPRRDLRIILHGE
jgi:hypothetical protein